MKVLGDGAIIVGMILAAIVVFAVDRKLLMATWYSLLGAVLSFFGVIHAGELGVGMATGPAIGYRLMAVLFFLMHQMAPGTGMLTEGKIPDESRQST